MKRILPSLFMLLFSFASSFASHRIAGIQLDYEALGNDKYALFMHVVRQCNSGTLPAQDLVALCSSSSITVLAANQTLVSKTKLNPCQGEVCSGNLEFEEWVWRAEIDFSASQCCECLLTYSNDYRENGQVFFVTAFLNKCAGAFSAKFQSKPTMLIGYNQDQELDFSIQASNTIDSVSFELTNGLMALNSSITYTGNYSPLRPMRFFGFPNQNLQFPAGFHIKQSGRLTFRPSLLNEVGPLVVLAVLWQNQNGTMAKIGELRSDIEVTVLSAGNNQAPSMKDFASSPVSDTFYICAGDTNLRYFPSIDTDNDSTYYKFLFADSTQEYFTDYSNGPQGVLALKMHSSLADTAASVGRQIKFLLTDRNCPIAQLVEYRWVFMPVKKPKADFLLLENCLQISSQTQIHDIGYSNAHGSWYLYDSSNSVIDSSIQGAFSQTMNPGEYSLKVSLGSLDGCSVDSIFQFHVLPHFQFAWMGDDSLCAGDTAQWELINQSGSGFLYSWENLTRGGIVGIDSIQNKAQLFPASNSLIQLTVEDSNGCQFKYVRDMVLLQKPIYTMANFPQRCQQDSMILSFTQQTNSTSIKWKDGDTSGFVRKVSIGGWYGFELVNIGYCATEDSFQVAQKSMLSINSKASDTSICYLSELFIDASDGDGPVFYQYNGISKRSLTARKSQHVQLVVKDSVGCKDTLAFHLWVPEKPSLIYSPSGILNVCENDSLFIDILSGIPKNATWIWSDSITTTLSRYVHSGRNNLFVQDSVFCKFDYDFFVEQLPAPNASFVVVNYFDSIQFVPWEMPGQHFWDLGDGFQSNKTSPTYQYNVSNTYLVTHTLTDTINQCSAIESQSHIITSLLEEQKLMSVYPNPFSRVFNVNASPGAEIFLYDMQGRELEVLFHKTGENIQVEVMDDLKKGLYVLMIRAAAGSKVQFIERGD